MWPWQLTCYMNCCRLESYGSKHCSFCCCCCCCCFFFFFFNYRHFRCSPNKTSLLEEQYNVRLDLKISVIGLKALDLSGFSDLTSASKMPFIFIRTYAKIKNVKAEGKLTLITANWKPPLFKAIQTCTSLIGFHLRCFSPVLSCLAF